MTEHSVGILIICRASLCHLFSFFSVFSNTLQFVGFVLIPFHHPSALSFASWGRWGTRQQSLFGYQKFGLSENLGHFSSKESLLISPGSDFVHCVTDMIFLSPYWALFVSALSLVVQAALPLGWADCRGSYHPLMYYLYWMPYLSFM